MKSLKRSVIAYGRLKEPYCVIVGSDTKNTKNTKRVKNAKQKESKKGNVKGSVNENMKEEKKSKNTKCIDDNEIDSNNLIKNKRKRNTK